MSNKSNVFDLFAASRLILVSIVWRTKRTAGGKTPWIFHALHTCISCCENGVRIYSSSNNRNLCKINISRFMCVHITIVQQFISFSNFNNFSNNMRFTNIYILRFDCHNSSILLYSMSEKRNMIITLRIFVQIYIYIYTIYVSRYIPHNYINYNTSLRISFV